MEIARILENKPKSKIYGLLGNINITTNNVNYSIVTPYKFKDDVKTYLNSKKDVASLKMVMLDETYLSKKSNELSESEIKSVVLAKVLIENKDYIVLDYFEKGFSYKEKENYKRLFKKLANDYNKTIVIFTNDITFLWDITEEIIVVDKNEVINSFKKSAYFKLIEVVDKPNISKLIDLIRKKGIKMEDYKETSDLLKAIYRMKENK